MPRFPILRAAVLALCLQGCATAAPVAAPVMPPEPVAAEAAQGPALWKVADADTTIYLFGTIHALPKDVQWFEGPLAAALDSAGELVTEIPPGAAADPASQQMIAMRAVMPRDQSLRAILSDEQRISYEAAMTRVGLPVAAFDRFEPWFAGMTLGLLPLIKQGYAADSGVEKIVETNAGPAVTRGALETLDDQISIFDNLPMDAQIAFLMSTADNIDQIVPSMDAMLGAWLAGDADALAQMMNDGLNDPVLAKAILHDRNAKWAGWVDDRLDQPGVVFVAVGAGHLAGSKSVQDYLAQRGITVARVQ
ncbi:TraB/GumN family protein [Qipengyuania marisflavi]|nr:TraB/GumN family protein [Qipengyuania marisflavi]